jgi:hypothetical protein
LRRAAWWGTLSDVSRRRARSLALLAAVAAVATAGCGSSTEHGPTKAAYIAKADAICASAHAQTNHLITQIKALATALVIGGTKAAPTAPALVAKLHTVAAAELARLRALAQPSGDHAAIAKFLGPLTAIVRAVGTATDDLRAGKAVDAASLFSAAIPTAQTVRSAAAAYGLHSCPNLLSALS